MGCDIHLVVQHKVNDSWQNVDLLDKEIDDRNYNLFSVFANVRNGTWSEPIPFISEPKGLPRDFSVLQLPLDYEYLQADESAEPKWLGDHSFSYLTLKELLDYNWHQPLKMKAYVDNEYLKTWDGHTQPNSYAGWSSNGTQVTWEVESIRSQVHGWYDKYIPWLQSIDSNPENVRLVFGFDS